MSTDRTALVPAAALEGQVVPDTRRIYRYTVPADDRPHDISLTSSPVHVANGATLDEVEFWAEHADGAPEVTRSFQVFGTGHLLPGNARYIGTCPRTREGLVWHLYELAGEERWHS